MPSNCFILYHPLLFLSSIFLIIRVFSSKSALRIRWPTYWSFSFSINPSNEYSGLIFFKIDDWFYLLAVGRTLKSLLQHHSPKASILPCSPFFMFQLSHPYMNWSNHWFNYTDFVLKVMPLLFNMLSRLVIAFIPRSKWLLLSWMQSLFAVTLEPPQIKVCHCFHFFPHFFPWSDGNGCHDLHFINVQF